MQKLREPPFFQVKLKNDLFLFGYFEGPSQSGSEKYIGNFCVVFYLVFHLVFLSKISSKFLKNKSHFNQIDIFESTKISYFSDFSEMSRSDVGPTDSDNVNDIVTTLWYYAIE